MTVLQNGNLVVGGDFASIGSVSASGIARWDGESWHAIGQGIQFPSGQHVGVYCVQALSNDDVIAGGILTGASGVSSNSVVRWDGEAWLSLAGGFSDPIDTRPASVFAVHEMPNGDLLVGGRYAWGAGLSRRNLAVWDGSQWNAFTANDPDSQVLDIQEMPNGSLVISGEFGNVGSVTARRLAAWDGASWSEVGGGLNGYTWPLSLTASGQLVVGGEFWLAGSTAVSNIAIWDGQAWDALAGGVQGGQSEAYAIAQHDGGPLVVAGAFTMAGGFPATFIAAWSEDASPSVAVHPEPARLFRGQSVMFSAIPTIGVANVTYQWLKNAVAMPGESGSLPSPTDGTPATLVITNVDLLDAASYGVRFENACGQAVSIAVPLDICVADFDLSGFVDTDDLTQFTLAFENGDETADVDASGFVDVDDFTLFMLEFESGC
jgi:hypothetical protein